MRQFPLGIIELYTKLNGSSMWVSECKSYPSKIYVYIGLPKLIRSTTKKDKCVNVTVCVCAFINACVCTHGDLHSQQSLASVFGIDGELYWQRRRHPGGVEARPAGTHLTGIMSGQHLHLVRTGGGYKIYVGERKGRKGKERGRGEENQRKRERKKKKREWGKCVSEWVDIYVQYACMCICVLLTCVGFPHQRKERWWNRDLL